MTPAAVGPKSSDPSDRVARNRSPCTAASPLLLFLLLLLSLVVGQTGCAMRSVRHNIVKENLLEVDLVRRVRGFSVEKKGYEHPAIISEPRLQNILAALEVEMPSKRGVIRQPAIHREIVEQTAAGLSKGLEQANPDEAVGIKVIRKQMKLGVFHTKFLTSFLAYMKDDQLYILLRRVEWPIPQGKEEKRLPEPMRYKKSMDFRVVTADPIYFVGAQDVEIDWRSDVFKKAFKMPGSTGGEKRRREVLEQSPITEAERTSQDNGGVSIGDLTPQQLRALADLEEDRRQGRITEAAYQRARRQLLRKR